MNGRIGISAEKTIRFAGAAMIFLSAFARAGAEAPRSVSAQYIGSHGFLIEGAGKKILLDSAMPSGKSDYGYIFPTEEIRAKIENAAEPYGGIDLITITHAHEDHYSPATVYGAMKNNPKAWLIATQEAYDDVLRVQKGIAAFKDRIWIPSIGFRASEERVVNGIPVGVTVIPHGPDGSMRLLTIVFELAGMRFLHLNEWNKLVPADYGSLAFNSRRADVAFLGYGFVTIGDKLDVFKTELNPRFTVICHVDGAKPSTLSSIQAAMDRMYDSYPMLMPTKPLDTIVFQKNVDGSVNAEIVRAP
jgi:L-ascorbate metabolism protein UlaG (beta-lactamase superfamily)